MPSRLKVIITTHMHMHIHMYMYMHMYIHSKKRHAKIFLDPLSTQIVDYPSVHPSIFPVNIRISNW